MLIHLAVHFFPYSIDDLCVSDAVILYINEHAVDELDDPSHLVLFEAAGGDSRRTETQTRSLERATAVKRNHVLVGRDICGYQRLLRYFTRQLRELGTQVNQHRVVVRTAGDDLIALIHERLRHDCSVGLHLFLIDIELLRQRFAEGYCFSGYHMLQRTALRAREDSRVE